MIRTKVWEPKKLTAYSSSYSAIHNRRVDTIYLPTYLCVYVCVCVKIPHFLLTIIILLLYSSILYEPPSKQVGTYLYLSVLSFCEFGHKNCSLKEPPVGIIFMEFLDLTSQKISVGLKHKLNTWQAIKVLGDLYTQIYLHRCIVQNRLDCTKSSVLETSDLTNNDYLRNEFKIVTYK